MSSALIICAIIWFCIKKIWSNARFIFLGFFPEDQQWRPLTAMILAEISREAGIPPGVWNTINGFGDEAGKALTEHPAIRAVALVGESATEEELREFCKGRIAHFKIPRYIWFVDEFPMTVTGKLQKFRMREIAMEKLQARAGN